MGYLVYAHGLGLGVMTIALGHFLEGNYIVGSGHLAWCLYWSWVVE